MDTATERLVGRTPPFKGVRRGALAKLLGKSELRTLARRDVLIRRGDDATGIGVVRSGVLREEVGPEGDRFLARFPRAGEVVGEVAFLTDRPHEADLVAHEESAVVWIPTAALEALLQQEPACARRLAAVAVEGRRRAEERLAHAARRGGEARLAARLLDLADAFGVRDGRGEIVNLRVTHRELAELAGTARETASLVVAAWQRAGLVVVDARRLVVVDRAGLVGIAGRDPAPGAPP